MRTTKYDNRDTVIGNQGNNSGTLYQTVNNYAGGYSSEEKDLKCLVDLRVTDPRDDKSRIEQTKGGLLENSYRWILGNADFQRWRCDENTRLLWIKGDPGKGKTMLLCGIINELKKETDQKMEDWKKTMDEERPAAGPTLLSFFFCQATDERINNATAILRSLIYVLLDQQRSLIPHVRRRYDSAHKGLFEDANQWIALSEIFTNILQDPSLGGAYLIIDALDECKDLPTLLKFIVKMSSTFPRFKWIVSSRNWPDIEKDLNAATQKVGLCLELKENAMQVSHAIDAYIDDKLSGLEPLHDDESLKHQVRDILRNKADGTFLWVALVVQELSKDEVEAWHVLQIVNEMPPGLDGMYDRMLDEIKRYKRDSEFCRLILSVATVAYRPLHLAEIGGLSGLPEQIAKSIESVRKIVAKCGSFLTVRDNQIYLVHQSAKDYLNDQASALLFPRGAAMTHQDIWNRSLKLLSDKLRRDIYGLCALGFPIDEVLVPDPDPLSIVRYSCVYWVDHLFNSQSSDNSKHPDVFRDGGTIDNFLRQHYLYWLEALSLCRSMSQGLFSITKLESMVQPFASQLPSLVHDMRRFALYCRWVVENHPLQVYASALVFSPARSMTRDLFKQEELRWVTCGPIVEDNWNACLQTLEGHSSAVWSVAFSPDSKLVVSGSEDQTVKIWDTATGACTQTLQGHSNDISSVAFSPDSKLVVSGSGDRTVKIWDAATGACTQTLKKYSSDVVSLKLFTSWSGHRKIPLHLDYGISPDDKWITRGSENWLWLPPGYRPDCSAVAASTIAIGCSSGRVLIMKFPTDN